MLLIYHSDPWAADTSAVDDAGVRNSSSDDGEDDEDLDSLYANPRRADGSKPLLARRGHPSPSIDPALASYRQRKNAALKQQDEVLDTMHSSVAHLRHIGSEVAAQFDEHEGIMEGLDDDVEVLTRIAAQPRCCLYALPTPTWVFFVYFAGWLHKERLGAVLPGG